jgi:hypothetical protein
VLCCILVCCVIAAAAGFFSYNRSNTNSPAVEKTSLMQFPSENELPKLEDTQAAGAYADFTATPVIAAEISADKLEAISLTDTPAPSPSPTHSVTPAPSATLPPPTATTTSTPLPATVTNTLLPSPTATPSTTPSPQPSATPTSTNTPYPVVVIPSGRWEYFATDLQGSSVLIVVEISPEDAQKGIVTSVSSRYGLQSNACEVYFFNVRAVMKDGKKTIWYADYSGNAYGEFADNGDIHLIVEDSSCNGKAFGILTPATSQPDASPGTTPSLTATATPTVAPSSTSTMTPTPLVVVELTPGIWQYAATGYSSGTLIKVEISAEDAKNGLISVAGASYGNNYSKCSVFIFQVPVYWQDGKKHFRAVDYTGTIIGDFEADGTIHLYADDQDCTDSTYGILSQITETVTPTVPAYP